MERIICERNGGADDRNELSAKGRVLILRTEKVGEVAFVRLLQESRRL